MEFVYGLLSFLKGEGPVPLFPPVTGDEVLELFTGGRFYVGGRGVEKTRCQSTSFVSSGRIFLILKGIEEQRRCSAWVGDSDLRATLDSGWESVGDNPSITPQKPFQPPVMKKRHRESWFVVDMRVRAIIAVEKWEKVATLKCLNKTCSRAGCAGDFLVVIRLGMSYSC